jgi:hypothetical protein
MADVHLRTVDFLTIHTPDRGIAPCFRLEVDPQICRAAGLVRHGRPGLWPRAGVVVPPRQLLGVGWLTELPAAYGCVVESPAGMGDAHRHQYGMSRGLLDPSLIPGSV